MSLNEHLSEEQILDSLFEAAEKLPEETVRIKRLDMQIVLHGLTSSKVDSIRERCTVRRNVKGAVDEKVDTETFNALLISEATGSLSVKGLTLNGWGDPRITSRLKLSGGEQAVRRMLLAGELDAVGDKVLELSGFGVEIADLKTDRLRGNDYDAVPLMGPASPSPRRVLAAAARRALIAARFFPGGNGPAR